MNLEMKVLELLKERDAGIGEISDALMVVPKRVGNTINRLEEFGLVSAVDKTNGRKVYSYNISTGAVSWTTQKQ